MGVRHIVTLAAAVAFAADIFGFAGDSSRFALEAAQSSSPAQPARGADQASKALQPDSRLLLIRGVDGETAKLVQSLPAGKRGFKVSVGKPLDMQHLRDALRLQGTAASLGDTIKITGLEFRSQEIFVQIDGGGKKHFNWRQHLQIGMGNVASAPPDNGPSQPTGGVLILNYGRPLPDMTPDELKRDLGVMLDFSKQSSAVVNWIDTIPPQFKQAIQDHRAMVGMDDEMVIAALGRPDHKVRERDADGQQTEDWVYGIPPAKTIFVTFAGNDVIRVKEFN
jgi:hypothetical protein